MGNELKSTLFQEITDLLLGMKSVNYSCCLVEGVGASQRNLTIAPFHLVRYNVLNM